MDDDDLRRGRPTCHIAYGENVAILAGDGLFAEAYRLVLERQEGEPERIVAALRELSRAISVAGMVGGQFIDVSPASRLDADDLRHMHELKTGKLITASVDVAPLLLGSPEAATIGSARVSPGARRAVPDRRRHPRRDRHAGRDGQAEGTDERLGKRTYVSVFGLERARELAGESHARRAAALDERAARACRATRRRLEQITDFMYTRES